MRATPGRSSVETTTRRLLRRLFERFDYLVAPTAQVFPFPIGETWPHEIAGRTMRTYHEWMTGVLLVTMAGGPSLAVPAGVADATAGFVQLAGNSPASLAFASCICCATCGFWLPA